MGALTRTLSHLAGTSRTPACVTEWHYQFCIQGWGAWLWAASTLQELLQNQACTAHMVCKSSRKDALSNNLWLGDVAKKTLNRQQTGTAGTYSHCKAETPVEAMNVHVLGKVSCMDCESYKRVLTKKLRLTVTTMCKVVSIYVLRSKWKRFIM